MTNSSEGSRAKAPEPPRILPVDGWPEADQAAWREACRKGIFLEPDGRAANWAPSSVGNVETAVGRFLAWRRDQGLSEAASLAEVVTPEAAMSFVQALAGTCTPQTIATYIKGLKQAVKLIAPGADWSWLGRLRGLVVGRQVGCPARPRQIPLAQHLLAAGLELMRRAEEWEGLGSRARAVFYRDGLIIAWLAAWPLRLGAFTGLRLGEHVVREPQGYIITVPATAQKNRTAASAALAPEMVSLTDAYLDRHRSRLLQCRKALPWDDGTLWLSEHGKHLSRLGLATMIRKRTADILGFPVTPHSFRHSAATTIALEAPERIGIASGVLTHRDPKTAERHYNLATGVSASTAHGMVLAERRETACSAKPRSRKYGSRDPA